MISIQHLSAHDVPAAGAVLDAAFSRRGMVQPLHSGYTLQPDNWFVARLDGQVAGVVGAYNYGPFAWIGMMGVHPQAQRRGIGLALMERLVGHLEDGGCPALLLEASADGQRLYPRVDFVPGGATLRMARRGLPSARPDGHVASPDRISPFVPADLPALVEFDAAAFGTARNAVLRSMVEKWPAGSFVARGPGGNVSGYVIAGSMHIGPWMAQSGATAELLLDTALSALDDGGAVLTLPAANTGGLALLERYGFVETERLLHMHRGPAPHRRPELIYAQASLALG